MSTTQNYTPYIPRGAITDTQREILHCTMETMADVGYVRTTIGVVSKQLGVSKGVIQYHFSSKEELVQEVIAYIYATARDFMSAQIWNTTDEWKQICSFIEVSCQFYQQYPTYIKALQTIRVNFQPAKHESLANTFYKQELIDLASVFVSGQAKGIFRAFDPDIVALTLRQALNGVTTCIYNEPSYDVRRHADELTTLFEQALLRDRDV